MPRTIWKEAGADKWLGKMLLLREIVAHGTPANAIVQGSIANSPGSN
jgi:hypothetical protein